MNEKWLKLAGDLLEKASEEFSNHGCNDWKFPGDWSLEEKRELVKAMHEENRSPGDYNANQLDMPDWWVMSFLGKYLRGEVKQ
jgi:hypothetical protein